MSDEWHGYVLITLNPGFTLSGDQKDRVRETVRGLAIREDRLPHRMFQVRLSLNGRQAIYEAVWNRASVTPGAVINSVAAALGLAPGTLAAGHIAYQLFADGGTWEDSRLATLAYLSAFRSEWDTT